MLAYVVHHRCQLTSEGSYFSVCTKTSSASELIVGGINHHCSLCLLYVTPFVIALIVCNPFSVPPFSPLPHSFQGQTDPPQVFLPLLLVSLLPWLHSEIQRPGYDLQCQGSRKFAWKAALSKAVRSGRNVLYTYGTIVRQ